MAIETRSPAERLAVLPRAERERIVRGVPADQMEALRWDWQFWARPKQLQPLPGGGHACGAPQCQRLLSRWLVWLNMGGRGAGKTRTGAEAVRSEVEANRSGRMGLVARTPADARDIMVEGESGILAVFPPNERPMYEPSKRRLTFRNGAVAIVFTSYEPDALRGPQFDFTWCDELASFEYGQETWDNMMLGLRLGTWPRCVVTTTPKPIKLLKDIIARPDTHLTRSTTYENIAHVAETFVSQIVSKYEGTRLGRQELYAELLDEMPGALWTRALIDRGRVKEAPRFARTIIAIDPAASHNEKSDETGIIMAAMGEDGHYYVLGDHSGRFSPNTWGQKAVMLYNQFEADRIVAEVNQGGEMVEHVLRTISKDVPYKAVHASKGKIIRAEPIAALYEQGRVHHVGIFPEMEDQMCVWVPGDADSPDRVDALVYALSELSQHQPGRVTMHQTVFGPRPRRENPLGLDLDDPKYQDADREG